MNKLADGIPLCETMHYKVLLADSICNQDGMGVAAALAKATEDQSVVMNLFRDALELRVDSVPPEPSALSSATRVSCVASGSGAVGGLSGGCRTLSVRKNVVQQFAGVHLHLQRGLPELTGVSLGGSSYNFIANDMLIGSRIL